MITTFFTEASKAAAMCILSSGPTLRPASLGRFEGGLAINEYAWNLSLDGCDAERGDLTEGDGWEGLLLGGFEPCATARIELEMTEDEVLYLSKRGRSAIVSQNTSGFISVEWFGTRAEARDAWNNQ